MISCRPGETGDQRALAGRHMEYRMTGYVQPPVFEAVADQAFPGGRATMRTAERPSTVRIEPCDRAAAGEAEFLLPRHQTGQQAPGAADASFGSLECSFRRDHEVRTRL